MDAPRERQDDSIEEAGLEPRTFDTPVVEVTLLEDRAHVVRRGRATLPAGTFKLTIQHVAPVLSDKTLSAETGAGARVHDLTVRREEIVMSSERPARIRDVETGLESLQLAIAGLTRSKADLDGQITALGQMAEQTLADIGVDASWGRVADEEWRGQLNLIAQEERDLRAKRVDQSTQLARLEVTRIDLERQKSELRGPGSRSRASIEVALSVEAPGEYELQLDYIVPGACWRPYHTARLIQKPTPRVVLECAGCVWQNTGEDWNDVQLLFSTQRPSLGTEPPLLGDDVIRLRKKTARVEVETREEEVYTTGPGAGPPAARSRQLSGIDDGGEVMNLRAARTARIPSDGRPYRVSIFEFDTSVTSENICIAELESSVFFKTTQTNEGPHPLLAGPVDLIRDSGLVGRTSVLYTARGERFDLGWGPDPELRVHRSDTKHEVEEKRLSSWNREEHSVEVHLSNLGATEKIIEVVERVPVS